MVDYIYKDGITFGDFDSIKERLLLVDRDDTPPDEKEVKETLPYSHGDLDFSRRLGQAFRNNRILEYTFFINETNHERRKVLEIKYENQLLKQGFELLYDTANHGYYYYGKCLTADVHYDSSWNRLKLVATFDCYPFMTSILPEGHDIWDEFNFELDMVQPQMTFHPRQTTFKPLKVGDRLTIGTWANQFESRKEIHSRFNGKSYYVADVKSITDRFISKRAYLVKELGEWVIEQDVVEAQDGNAEFTLYNPGTSSVTPKITLSHKMTLILNDEEVVNLPAGEVQNDFVRLKPGANHLVVAVGRRNPDATINFEYYKELI